MSRSSRLARAHGAFGDAESRGDVARSELLERREDERDAQVFGQGIDQVVNLRVFVGKESDLLGAGGK